MKYIFIIILLMVSAILNAQTPLADELVNIQSVTTTQMNAISNPVAGSFAFNTTENRMYQFDGITWIKIAVTPTIRTVTGDYTLVAADNGNIITVNSASNTNLTVASGLPLGFNVSVYQVGAGRVTIIGSGTTIRNRLNRFTTSGIHAGIGIVATSMDVFHLTGDLRR